MVETHGSGETSAQGGRVQRLGVSRGSFYWHFKDRIDFVRQLVDYWSVIFNVRSLFAETGSKGDELEMRTRTLRL